MTKPRAELTRKQRLFVEAYCGQARGNATEAARLAGYSGSDLTLSLTGLQNLRNPKISAAIIKMDDEHPKVKSPAQIREFWSRLMDEAEREADRLRASELLAKSSAMFVERVEHTGRNGEPIQQQVVVIPANGREGRLDD